MVTKGIREREANESEEIRKGPWKAEEDEVLINHVKKYGPRDWSSIRSKGLLQRTGKSCRLRWVNKLRPNLKNGCKFSMEEERVVIELQAQFGNKWARIATYLPGRTDNDVKNFWSSRQKRLARILQTPTPSSSSSKPHKHSSREVPVFHHIVPMLEESKFSSSMNEESSSSRPHKSCSSSHIDNSEMIKMVPLPDLVMNPDLLNFDSNTCHHLDFPSTDQKQHPYCNEFQTQIVTFPQIPQPPPEIPFSPESQELVARLEDPNYMDVFGADDDSGTGNIAAQLPSGLPFFEAEKCCRRQANYGNPVAPDSFFDDFPTDMFDHIEPLPSPSDW